MNDGLGVVVVERSEAVVEAVDVELGVVVGEKVLKLKNRLKRERAKNRNK